jgi:hypothetical protein
MKLASQEHHSKFVVIAPILLQIASFIVYSAFVLISLISVDHIHMPYDSESYSYAL